MTYVKNSLGVPEETNKNSLIFIRIIGIVKRQELELNISLIKFKFVKLQGIELDVFLIKFKFVKRQEFELDIYLIKFKFVNAT